MQIILLTYSLILFCGAYFGLKAGSKISLIMGIIFGFLTLGASFLLAVNIKYGYYAAFIISAMLTGSFLSRLVKTRKFMPAGLLLIVSLIVLAVSIRGLVQL